MTRKLLVAFCLVIAVGGIGMAALPRSAPPPVVRLPASTDPSPTRANSATPPKPGDRFDVDVASLRGEIDNLAVDERREQIADWAVIGTVMQQGLSAEEARGVLFDKPPVRLSSLTETFNFEYGDGRRAVLPSGAVWLFRPERDPHPEVTIGRLADQVRMELGDPPAEVTVFTYHPDLVEGVIHLRCAERVSREALFGPKYGYVESTVSTRKEFQKWLESIDDVVHARLNGDAVDLGGRRFERARTLGASLADVAALYQAHKRLKEKNASIEEEINRPVERFNSLVREFNASQSAPGPSFYTRLAEIRRMLSLPGASRVSRVVEDEPAAAGVDDSADGEEAAEGTDSLAGADPAVQRILERLRRQQRLGSRAGLFRNSVGDSSSYSGRLRAKQALESLEGELTAAEKDPQSPWSRHARALSRQAPREPGFSLDPVWNTRGLVRDLRLLRDDTNALRTVLLREARAGMGARSDARIDSAQAALEASTFLALSSGNVVPAQWGARLGGAIAALERADRDSADEAVVPLLEIEESLKHSNSLDDAPFLTTLAAIKARNRQQCARYDGPLKGTEVGMNLFYTDLLAKLWVSVDYYHSAPTRDVLGFISSPRTDVEPTYWDEIWARPNTRLWFGVKPENYARTADARTLNFAHVATRVYSAGSNPLKPGVEERPAESSRRAFGWWDRHYERVANHEPQYHRQNQIMKWSVLTGWLSSSDTTPYLDSADIHIARDRRFDRWYRARADLRFHQPIRFTDGFGLSDTECLPILRSYDFFGAGRDSIISGGVSLGGLHSLETGATVSAELTPMLRRGGLAAESTSTGLKALKGTQIELPPPQSLRLAGWSLKPAPNAATRLGGTDLNVGRFEARLAMNERGGQLHVAADAHDVGTLAVEKTAQGVRMSWVPGDVDVARSHAREVARLLAADHDGQVAMDASRLRSSPELAVDPSVYMVEKSDGTVVTISGGGAGKGGGGGDGTYLRTVAGGAPEPNKSLLSMASVPYDGVKSKSVPIRADFVAAKEAMADVNAARWQRLSAAEPGESLRDPGVMRVFTQRGPPDGAATRQLKLADGQIVQARVHDGALYVERGAALSDEGFNDLVQTLSAPDVRRALDPAAATQPVVVGKAPGAARAAEELVGSGRIARTIDQLASDRTASFDEVLKQFEAESTRKGWSRAARGEDASWVRNLFGEAPRGNADEAYLLALADVQDGNRAGAVRAATAATGTPSPEALDAVTKLGRRQGDAAVIADYAAARAGHVPGLAPEVAGKVRLVNAGHAVHSVLPVEGAAREVSAAEAATLLEQIRSGRATVYSEKGGRMADWDWDTVPSRVVGDAFKDPNVTVEVLEAPGLGSFRPTHLETDLGVFVRRDVEKTEAASSTAWELRPERIVRIRINPAPHANQQPSMANNGSKRGCDFDRDGRISESELDGCCDLNHDGSITSNERDACRP